MKVTGATFLVSGGGSGLGAACARMLVAAGANVVIADVNADTGESLAAELGTSARFVQTDVTDETSVAKAVSTALHAFGSLQGSVQCAGVALAEKVLGKAGPNPLAHFLRVIHINLVG